MTIQLQPGEHIRDAVFRAIEQNGFVRTNLALRLAGASSFRSLSALTSLANSDEIIRLVDVLGLRRDAERLHELLANGSVQGRQYVSFFGHHLRRSQFAVSRRVAPSVLRKDEYQRAIWSVRWLSFDPETMEQLLDKCPVCRSTLGWAMTRGVCYCDKCADPKVDLRDFPQPHVEADDEEALRYVVETIDPLISDSTFASRWQAGYPAQSRGELFEFGVQIAMECERHQSGRRGSVESIAPKSLALAGRALLKWPSGLVDLVDRLSSSRCDLRILQYLQHDALLSTSVRGDLKELVDVQMRRRAIANFQGVAKPPVTTAHTASQAPMRNARTALMELIKRPGQVTDRLEVSFRVVRDVKSVRLKSRELGISVPDVIELYLAGFLCSLRPDLCPIGINPETDREIDVSEHHFFASAANRSRLGIDLATLRFILDQDLSTSWSQVMQAIMAGKLPTCRYTLSGLGLLHDLRVDDFAAATAVFRDSEPSLGFHDVSITHAEMGLTFGKSRALAAKIIKQFDWHGKATLAKLVDLRRTNIFGFELLGLGAMKGTYIKRLSEKLSKAGIPHVGRDGLTLWDRTQSLQFLGLDTHIDAVAKATIVDQECAVRLIIQSQ
ncbi:hypothetical protein [Rhizobium laguerreae]|uniref:hypothetical protein n=1 Tax=Rhizobium laguerreae TaxID=1076926 RepID=UPI001C924676|nr:hypothetical protein [Rhizobium laguerreae]MBY3117314.1 hypothetical protein [Rhizobium laguerreae]